MMTVWVRKRTRRKRPHLITADATLDFKVLPKRLTLTSCRGLGPTAKKGGVGLEDPSGLRSWDPQKLRDLFATLCSRKPL